MTWKKVKFRQWIWLNCTWISSSKTRNILLSLKTILLETHQGQENHLSFEVAFRRKRNRNIPQCLQPFNFPLKQIILIGAWVKKMADKTLLTWGISIVLPWMLLSQASSLSLFTATVSATSTTLQQQTVQFQELIFSKAEGFTSPHPTPKYTTCTVLGTT